MSQDSISPASLQAEPWLSTKALSVYNVLRALKRGIVPMGDAVSYLREWFDPRYPELWVTQGAEYLFEHGFASISCGTVIATRTDGAGVPVLVVRCNNDADLRFA